MKSNKFIEELKANKMAKMGKVINKVEPIDNDLNLTELRLKYPNVNSNSKAGFLKKLSNGN